MTGIKNVSIIGLGALGIMYGHLLSKHMPFENLRIIADQERIQRYTNEGIYCNGEKCHFNYVLPTTPCQPADLLIFTVKYTQLPQAIEDVKHHIGKNTIILSALNGIVSEEKIADKYGIEHILYCIALGMDAVKDKNHMNYQSMGHLCFGEFKQGESSEKVERVRNFFDQVTMPYEVDNNMSVKLWSKLMANVGINQTVTIYGGNNSIVQEEGQARTTMIKAMEEVLTIAQHMDISLTYDDIDYWLDIFDNLNPEGMPSMAQDRKAKRYSEVELFAGTIVNLGKKLNIPVPTNQMLYDKIHEIEGTY